MGQIILEYSASAQKIVQESVFLVFNYKKRIGGSEPAIMMTRPAGIPPELFIMKKREQKRGDTGSSPETDPVLLKAHDLLSDYSRATGAMTCVHDHTFLPIPEMFEDINIESNICLFCTKYRSQAAVKKLHDLAANPCNDMHINGIREARYFGGTRIYMCEMGFMFWTSPLYTEGRFIGALTGSGFLGVDPEETAAEMHRISGGVIPLEEIKKQLAPFSRCEPGRLKALSELLLICAEHLSPDASGCHGALKRRAEQQLDLSGEILKLKEKYPEGAEGPVYPLDKERMLLTALRRGDAGEGKKILNELLAFLFFFNPDDFKYTRFRAIELAVQLFRINYGPDYAEKSLLETSSACLDHLQNAQNIEDLADTLHAVVDHVTEQIASFQGIRHVMALQKAEHFIRENFTRKISLGEIAAISGLSAPYFSTVFKEEMGENLSSYLNRLRVEKALSMLTGTDFSLSEIAGSCGFEDQSWFSKIFKHYTGISPGKYRSRGKTGPEIPEGNFSAAYRGMVGKE
jgi:AraC-like DNA-binding protein/ligand-binding sensor protein